MTKAIIYTKELCVYCQRAKELLNTLGIPYHEYLILPDDDERPLPDSVTKVSKDDLLKVAPNAKTVPQIWLDDEHVGGYSDLVARYPEQALTIK